MAASNLRNNIDITDTTVGVTVSEDVYRDVFLSFICFVLSLFPCDSYHQTLESSFFFSNGNHVESWEIIHYK